MEFGLKEEGAQLLFAIIGDMYFMMKRPTMS
jgi:hypothetical protein